MALSFKSKKELIDINPLVNGARRYADRIIADTVKSALSKAVSQVTAAASSDIRYSNRDISINELIKPDHRQEQSFVDKLIVLIRESGRRDPDIYKAAGINRRLFSKIMSDSNYTPSKDTCISLALAL